jgi:diguanylate cyclase (GGDEF)-like protein/PAS domain S-box-containing protein
MLWGNDVQVASDIPEALAHMASHTCDVIVAHFNSFNSGVVTALVDHVKEVPVIVLVSAVEQGEVLQALKDGAFDLIADNKLEVLQIGLARAAKFVKRLRQQKKTEDALRESEERYALAARGANDGLWDWKFGTFGDPPKIYLSPRWKAMLGYAANEIGDRPDDWLKLIHPEDQARFQEALKIHFKGQTPQFECEYRVARRDGTYSWVLARGLAVLNASGQPIRIAGSTGLVQRGAVHDPVTGLPNRLLLLERLGHEVKRARHQESYQYAVLFMDLDRFKLLAETLGHKYSDELLVQLSKRLANGIRPQDLLARMAADRFAILLEDVKSVMETTQIAQDIQTRLSKPFGFRGEEIFLTACIGIAMSATGYARAEDVLRDSEAAMHRAKNKGRGKIELFDVAMHEHAVEQLHFENDLRRAIARDEFILHYQPIVDLQTGEIVSFEALVRWKHPEKGFIPPVEFIFMAEETGLIVPLGESVLSKACEQLRTWQLKFAYKSALSVSVNLSVKQLEHPALVATTAEIVQKSKVLPGTIKLEVTESVLMENLDIARRILDEFKALNIPLLMDDFGTGYSSLGALHTLPLDALKIDRTFIANMLENERSRVIVRSIVALGTGLGLQIIAEGVETKEQMLELRKSDCHLAQGYYFSKPVDAEHAEEFLSRGFKIE